MATMMDSFFLSFFLSFSTRVNHSTANTRTLYVLKIGIVIVIVLVFYLSLRGRHSGQIRRNLRYKSWFNYIATVNRYGLTSWGINYPQMPGHTNPPNRGKHLRYICCRSKDGLSDQMFVFASSYGIAKEKNRILITGKNFLPMFTLKSNASAKVERMQTEDICSKAKVYPLAWENRLQKKKQLDFGDDLVVILDGQMTSWRYFKNAETELRQMFTFKPNIRNEAQRILHEIRVEHFGKGLLRNNVTFVGIYVQRRLKANRLKKIMLPPRSYFLKAMLYFKQKFQHIIFVLISDSPTWCRENLPSNFHLVNMNSSSPALHMAVLSQCNHTVISIGTFGWWSAWLANGTTTYFKPLIRRNWYLRKMIRTAYSEFFWPGWIPIVASPESIRKKNPGKLLHKTHDIQVVRDWKQKHN